MAKEITLEEIFQSIKEEDAKQPIKPPLSFTSKEFREMMECGRQKAARVLNQLNEEGKIKSIQVPITDKLGRKSFVKGWQWQI